MASGDTLLVLTAASAMPTAANAAGLEALAGASTPAEAFLRLAFDDTTDEYADWHCVMPASYAGGGITVTLVTGAAAASGTYTMGLAFRRIEDDVDDLDTTAHTYAFNDSSAITAPSAVGEVGVDTVTFTDGTDMDSVAAGDPFVLRIYNDASVGTVTGDAYVYRVVLSET